MVTGFNHLYSISLSDLKKINPSVTIAIPVLNEEKFIGKVLDVFVHNSYENIIQICVADGGSEDRTKDIVLEYSKKDPRVVLVDNPKKYQSFALNEVLKIAKGNLFLRADGHCIYDEDYVEASVNALLKSGATNAGGTQRYIAKNRIQAGIAISSKNFFGNGGAKYMDETFEGYADTVFLGCFRTEELKKIGGFSEVNLTNEDAEINLRIKRELNGSVYVSPSIKTWYYPRVNYLKLFKQYFRYGKGRFITNKLHDGNIPYRSKAPFYFISFMIMYGGIDFFLVEKQLGAVFVFTAIVLLVLFESIRFSYEKQEYFENDIWNGEQSRIPGPLSNAVFCFFTLLIMNGAHFLGYGWQMVKTLFVGLKW